MSTRKRFEAWWRREHPTTDDGELERNGRLYVHWCTQFEWDAYRAGFAAGRKERK